MKTLEDKTMLITGGTSGIGLEAARTLAEMGAEILLAGRNAQKTEAVVRELRQQTRNERITPLVADLSSQAGVRSLAEQALEQAARLDVLLNNAGAFFDMRQLSPDGLELTFALNHLGYFYLTHLLLPALHAAPAARIVNVSSGAHVGGHIRFDDLQSERSYSGWGAYAQSKLANILFTYELARRLQGTAITANALHPGFVATNFGRNNKGLMGAVVRFSQAVALSPQKGAQTSIYLASSAEVEGVTGKYFYNSKAVSSSPESYDVEIARRLWQVSEELVGLRQTA